MEIGGHFLRVFLLLCVISTSFNRLPATASILSVSHDRRALKINGTRRILISGSIHYPRSTPEMWPDLIDKAKDGGIDVIETYVFWNGHEPVKGQYNFEGRFDLVRFLKTVQEAGLLAHLRIGPYVCAEWNFGGFPVWLHLLSGLKLMRTDDEQFKNEMQIFTTKIVNMMKEENLFAWQGGPIILAQIENEYGNVEPYYGIQGQSYMHWAVKMAESLNTGVPWVMCQQADAPYPIINTCNGFYCDRFQPNSTHKSPKMWTENWSGWFQSFGGTAPHRPSEDVAFSVARFFQSGGTFQNYYMYHGGTNFDRTSGGPFITTSYDYDAPIDEYGNLRQPKWGHLKQLHSAIKLCEHALTHGRRKIISFGHDLQATVYTEKRSGICAAFLSNSGSKWDANVVFRGNSYNLPAWSVSILPDCKNVVYNTAKITTQTSLMGMKNVRIESLVNTPLSIQENPYVNWTWHRERIGHWGNDSFSAKGLLEQINTAQDRSDYLWYTTSVNVDGDEPFLKNNSQPVLNVKSQGHALHAFVNGQFAGTTTGTYENPGFTLQLPITLKAGENKIALLSMTVGLQNYGKFFDTWTAGITGVWLTGFKKGTVDLSSREWVYKIGLKGEHLQIYSDVGAMNVEWKDGIQPPEHTALTWYKSEFNAPDGNQPVALNLSSMSKGQAWINGMNIGRYWASYIAPTDGCSATCDYRGPYSSTNCASKCGQASQTLYHIPRSWLRPTGNSLVLLEEIGGIPSGISFATIYVDRICGHVSQADPSPKLRLKCSSGQRISSVSFASFGNPEGSCGSFYRGSCNARNSSSIVEKACVGRTKCFLAVSEEIFGNPCDETIKSLAVEAVCRF